MVTIRETPAWTKLFLGGLTAARLLALGIMWWIASMPVVTVIPASMALYAVFLGWPEPSDSVVRLYAMRFRQLFTRSYRLAWPFALAGFVLLVEAHYYVLSRSGGPFEAAMVGVVVGFVVLWLASVAFLPAAICGADLLLGDYIEQLRGLGFKRIVVASIAVAGILLLMTVAVMVFRGLLAVVIVPVGFWAWSRIARLGGFGLPSAVNLTRGAADGGH